MRPYFCVSMKKLETIFESLLWSSRLMVLVGVVSSVFLAIGAFYMATLDVWYLLGRIVDYPGDATGEARADVRAETITYFVKAVDGYLIAAIMLLFAFGLYELFVNRIAAAENSEVASRLLHVNSLDDLKDRVAKLILLVLVIEFFQVALKMPYKTPADLLYLATGVLFIGGAFYLSALKPGKVEKKSDKKSASTTSEQNDL